MVNASLINRLSQATDLLEQQSQQNRPLKVITVRRGLGEDQHAGDHFAAHSEDRGANITVFEFYE